MDTKILTSVAMACRSLSDEQLNALNICMILNTDPHGRLFDYETVKHLFTENNGTRAHNEVKESVEYLTFQRLSRQ